MSGGHLQDVMQAWFPLEPQRADINDSYWHDMAQNPLKQKELQHSKRYWREKDAEAQEPNIIQELLKPSVLGRDNPGFKY